MAAFDVGLYGQSTAAVPGVRATAGLTAAIELAAPMTLRVHYTDEAVSAPGGQESRLRIVHYDPASQRWHVLPTTLDTFNNLATTQTTLLGEFALVSVDYRLYFPLMRR